MNIFCKVSQSCKVQPEDGFSPEILKEGTPVYMIEIIDSLCAIRYLSKSGWKVGHAERRYITPTTSCKTRFYSVSQLDKNKWQAMTWFEGAVEPYYMHSYSAESAAKDMEFEMMARGIENPKCTSVVPLSLQKAG